MITIQYTFQKVEFLTKTLLNSIAFKNNNEIYNYK